MTQEFSTGAVRDGQDGKPRLDLISPIALKRLGEWMAKGAEKYAERNWEKGIPVSRCLASLYRHLNAIQLGDGEEEEEDHEAAVLFNAMAILHTRDQVRRGLLPGELDDLPDYGGEAYEEESTRLGQVIPIPDEDWDDLLRDLEDKALTGSIISVPSKGLWWQDGRWFESVGTREAHREWYFSPALRRLVWARLPVSGVMVYRPVHEGVLAGGIVKGGE